MGMKSRPAFRYCYQPGRAPFLCFGLIPSRADETRASKKLFVSTSWGMTWK